MIDLPNKRLIHAPTYAILNCETAGTPPRALHYSITIRFERYSTISPSSSIKSPAHLNSCRSSRSSFREEHSSSPRIQHFNSQAQQMVAAHFKELGRLKRAGPHRPVFSSRLAVVVKKNGSLRICGDYRALNLNTINNAYSLPHLL